MANDHADMRINIYWRNRSSRDTSYQATLM
jgi:hypothetical protein